MALPPRMVRFRQFLLGVTALAHGPFAITVAQVARQALGVSGVASAAIATVATGASLGLYWRRMDEVLDDRPLTTAHRQLLSLPYFVHWFACFVGTVLTILALLAQAILSTFRDVPTVLSLEAIRNIHLVALVIGVWGVYPGRLRFSVREREVSLKGLPKAFDGYRIAQLSDIHIGGLTPKIQGLRWTNAAIEAGADLIVVTGDSVTNGTLFHQDIAEVLEPLAQSKPRDGVVYSMGNHDYFNDGQPLRDLLTEAGIAVLRNTGRTISRGNAEIYLAAIDDVYTGKADLDATFAGRPSGSDGPLFTIFLAHDPKLWDGGRKRNANLTLSGHTHGGQIAFPFFARTLSLSAIAHRHHLGFYRDRLENGSEGVLYVHPGLGTTGPPVRIGVPAEVTILVLRCADSE